MAQVLVCQGINLILVIIAVGLFAGNVGAQIDVPAKTAMTFTIQSTTPTSAAAERPLSREEFVQAAPQGFGDRHNSKAWSMIWWNDALYVGTARAIKCTQDANLAFRIGDPVYYPDIRDLDVECTESPQDLPLRAEMWRLAPQTATWDRVYRSPEDVEIPGYPGNFVARDIGYRDMIIFNEQLFVDGVSSLMINPGVPPPRLLRSKTGFDFEAVPQDPGTVLGDFGFGQATMRSMASYNGRLFISIGQNRGFGALYEAANPEGGNDNFRLVGPPEMKVYEMCVYNGYLYIGLTQNSRGEGYSVVKTDATGEPPYTFIPVVTNGGFNEPFPSNTVVSMYVYKNRLYVGTDKPAEIIRINPDDSWQLLVGRPRNTPDGPKYPLSGMTGGFDWMLNEHIWRMVEYKGWLYIGTNDLTTLLKKWDIMKTPIIGGILKENMGYDLAVTSDGWYYTIIDRSGFGDRLDIGIRTFAATPYGLFFGTSNPYYGLCIWQGVYNDFIQNINPPKRLDAEIKDRSVLLSWESPGDIEKFRIFRSCDGGLFEEIGTTDQLFFKDSAVSDNQSYRYYVIAEAANGRVSQPSNSTSVPSYAPVVSFNGMAEFITRLDQKNKLTSPKSKKKFLLDLNSAHNCLMRRELHKTESNLRNLLENIRQNRGKKEDKTLDVLSAEDMEIMLGKLLKRIRFVQAGLLAPSDL